MSPSTRTNPANFRHSISITLRHNSAYHIASSPLSKNHELAKTCQYISVSPSTRTNPGQVPQQSCLTLNISHFNCAELVSIKQIPWTNSLIIFTTPEQEAWGGKILRVHLRVAFHQNKPCTFSPSISISLRHKSNSHIASSPLSKTCEFAKYCQYMSVSPSTRSNPEQVPQLSFDPKHFPVWLSSIWVWLEQYSVNTCPCCPLPKQTLNRIHNNFHHPRTCVSLLVTGIGMKPSNPEQLPLIIPRRLHERGMYEG